MRVSKQKTNYRIVIHREGWTDDGKGLAKDQAEATKMFNRVIGKITDFKLAELYFDNILIKKV